MNARPVLFLIMSLCTSFILNVADRSVGGRRYERRYDISGVTFNVPGGKVRSLLRCGALCARSSSCKAFCYSQSTALCHLSQPYDPIVQQYDVSDSKCYNPIRSVLRCGDLCARSSSCKAFCYSQSTALCHLSQPYDPIVQQYNGSDLEFYNPTGCPTTKGYAWYGARCIKGYSEKKANTDARAICTQDGGHLYHFKALEWDMQPIVDLLADNVNMDEDDHLLMGADDLEVRGHYKWSDSSLLADDSLLWSSGEPSGGAARCVMLTPVTFKLHDVRRDSPRKFVCQIDA